MFFLDFPLNFLLFFFIGRYFCLLYHLFLGYNRLGIFLRHGLSGVPASASIAYGNLRPSNPA